LFTEFGEVGPIAVETPILCISYLLLENFLLTLGEFDIGKAAPSDLMKGVLPH